MIHKVSLLFLMYIFILIIVACGKSKINVSISPETVATPSLPFSPSDIENLSLWLDAQDDITLSTNDCVTIFNQATDTDTVSCWFDKSGNLNHATATGNPTYASNDLNTENAIAFTADKYEISDSDLLDMQLANFTIYLVYKTISASKMSFVSKRGTLVDSNGYRGYLIYGNTGNVYAMICDTDDTAGDILLTSAATYHDGTAHLVKYQAQRDQNFDFYVDTLLEGTPVDISPSIATTIENANKLVIGGRSTTAASTLNNFTGSIGEILIYKKKLTVEENSNVNTYLTQKWGL